MLTHNITATLPNITTVMLSDVQKRYSWNVIFRVDEKHYIYFLY